MFKVKGVISCLILVASWLNVASAENIYQVEVNAGANVSNKELVDTAFERIMLKVTGRYDTLDNEILLKYLPPLPDLVHQQTVMGDGRALFEFNSFKVNQLLRQAQISVWPTPRPNTLFWVVQDQDDQKTLLSEHAAAGLITGLKEGAQVRAMPITFPLLDFDDLNQISITDVWGRFLTPVVTASQRYNVDYIVLIKATLAGRYSQLTWQLIDAQGLPLLQGEEVGLVEDSSVQVSHQLADYFVGQSSRVLAASDDDYVVVQVENVNAMADVVMVKRFFQQLSNVSKVTLKTIAPGNMQLQLQLMGSQEELKQTIAMHSNMTEIEQDIEGVDLSWRWQVIDHE
ncbi:DUF2066 domain-containing protein [Motilimonas sp. 1_MG-2023]|uniref:DUF2066 domain-containing protein n=1 Tax=Motilimonas sp. 1_MG-2023 TaxID=3062672 RepID=UPI0026E341D7|nr:DUF2066 domain-containing protein [Motilimonas sp. 1_MG-2023]MDO6525169.1 DUF2066 domain-containing protein [Motilimonas sp. 1_MG-2023]